MIRAPVLLMTDRPTQAFTFLFTDIEGSTRLWEQQPKAMCAALAQHDTLLRDAIEGSGGRIFKTIGEAFCAVFAAPEAALQAALTAQRALLEELPELRVRMALHTGEAEAVGEDYLGPALNRVARLLAAGHGGQVLLSQATVDALRASLAPETHLRPLGAHRLRDLAAREAIYQLAAPHLPDEFPPLNTLDEAFRRGIRRATAVAAVVVTVMAGLAMVAMSQARLARAQRHAAERQRKVALEGQKALRRTLYAAQMNLGQQAWEQGAIARTQELLEAWRPPPNQEDLRGFEWRYLWHLAAQDDALSTIMAGQWVVTFIAYSPDGKLLAWASDHHTLTLWDAATRRNVATLKGHTGAVQIFRFSPDGKILATGSGPPDATVRLWDVATRREIGILRGHTSWANPIAFSPDGRTLVSFSGEPSYVVNVWDVRSQQRVNTLHGNVDQVSWVGFSPDGRTLATSCHDGTIRLWSTASWVQAGTLTDPKLAEGVAFSPDGTALFAGERGGTVRVWRAAPFEETDLSRVVAGSSDRLLRRQ